MILPKANKMIDRDPLWSPVWEIESETLGNESFLLFIYFCLIFLGFHCPDDSSLSCNTPVLKAHIDPATKSRHPHVQNMFSVA